VAKWPFLLLLAALHTGAQAQAVHLNPAAKRALVEKAMTLKKGDSYATVIDRLGKPAVDRTASGRQGGTFVSRTLTYNAVRQASGAYAALDEHVDVYLDKSGRVRAVYVQLELE
jgi:hypothetical protein